MMKNAEALELAKQLAKDQQDWLDDVMRKHVPKVIHDKFVRGDFSQQQMSQWLRRNRMRLIFLSNTPIVRLVKTVNGEDRILDEFRPRIMVGDREIDIWKLLNSDNVNPADIWADEDKR